MAARGNNGILCVRGPLSPIESFWVDSALIVDKEVAWFVRFCG
jgi:hypothetical protein